MQTKSLPIAASPHSSGVNFFLSKCSGGHSAQPSSAGSVDKAPSAAAIKNGSIQKSGLWKSRSDNRCPYLIISLSWESDK